MKKIKKLLAILLPVILLISVLPIIPLTVSANQSTAFEGGFSTNYTLSGDGATDIVAVARAQEGKTQSQLKYTEQWCDNFVSDCAILANQAAAVPQGGNVGDFRNKLIAAGATEVSSPKAGDIVVFYCTSCKSWAHVGIMYDSQNCYNGNNWSGGYSHVKSTQCKYYRDKDEDGHNNYTVLHYYRPNYTSHTHSYERGYEAAHPHKVYMMCSCGDYYYTGETTFLSSCEECLNTVRPEKPTLNISSGPYYENKNITFSWQENNTNLTHYCLYFDIYDEDTKKYVNYDYTQIYVKPDIVKSFPIGKYKARLLAYNSNYWEADDSDWLHVSAEYVYFTVVSNSYPDVPKINTKVTGNKVHSWWDECNNADSYNAYLTYYLTEDVLINQGIDPASYYASGVWQSESKQLNVGLFSDFIMLKSGGLISYRIKVEAINSSTGETAFAFSDPIRIEYFCGDINGDESVNNKDLTRLFQHLSDWDVEVNVDALDVNGDGAVNNKDLTRLFQYLSDWDVQIF
ncbi:MAG: hypothetical protein IKZ47_00055 [Clostridia bacterium]|nr:hypothetical protein [Clostridia bacterium]